MADEMQAANPQPRPVKRPKKRGRIKAWFTEPNKRARLIIWAGVGVMGFAAFIIVALGATSSYWFCANVCHVVQDDTIIAYNRSSHNHISCIACHMPVNADPVTFLLHKANGLIELYQVVSGQAELPLNPEDEVAKTMPSAQCTQCHSDNRQYTTTPGIIMNHEAHAKNGVTCPTCHNRVAHKEDFKLTLAGNRKHEDWMKMEACFRCHSLDPNQKGLNGLNAPGKCSTCHPANFELKPENHAVANFVNPGPAAMAALNATGSAETSIPTGHPGLYKSKGPGYCYMCHDQQTFCNACHGTPMPHSEDFMTKSHGDTANKPGMRAKCEMCHQQSTTKFCDKCHHGTQSAGWSYDPKTPWQQQHPAAIAKAGDTKSCMVCHKAEFCAACHTNNHVIPADHNAATWLRPPDVKQGHPGAATKSPASCEICHGTPIPNAPFCKSCHQMDMPHGGDWKTSHGPLVQQGKPAKAVCINCHAQAYCDSCHHQGSSSTTSWLQVHPGVVKSKGSAGCFQSCHQEAFCSNCHVHLVNGVPTTPY